MARPRILIADDEEGVRESLNLILSDHYDVTMVTDGAAALAKATQEPFDMVCLDIKMPKMDGLDVLRQLKQRGVRSAVLMVTAYQSVELAQEAVRLGAVDYLPKPFDRQQILDTVQVALQRGSSKSA